MTISPGTRLGPYDVISPLGAGGMGEVYRAHDTRLDRDVAVKVLPDSVGADPEALARFEREAKAVAALSHPNILAIHDFGTHQGVAYAVMELLEGESLRRKLDESPISRKQAVDYALQVAAGLSAAHERGIIHRDLKPENLFVTQDGRVKILDFGLAKRLAAVVPGEETSAPTVSGHTEPGTVMGTVGYKSPEQVRGLSVDHRSDIFSFGAILYELLSGRRAFKRGTPADTMSAILKEEPPELAESGQNVPVALDHIVRHCDRENRFQSARDVAFALGEASGPMVTSGAPIARPRKRPVLIAAAVVIVLGIASLFLLRRFRNSGVEAGVKRVAVLPFENLGSAEDDYFADGIADAVRGKLTSLRGVEVIARGSSIVYKKTTKTPKNISDELDAPYLLTATVRWQKSDGTSRVQVSPELVEIKKSGAPASKWQQPFDAALTDVFQVQSEIGSRVAQELGVALGATEEKRLSEKPTQNLAAYDAFLKGEEASTGMGASDPASLRRAIDFYERAVALDPGFAQAWARLSRGTTSLYFNGSSAIALAERARQAAEKAVALAPNHPDGYEALGSYQRLIVHDADNALKQLIEGQRRAPGNADLLTAIALTEQTLGHWDMAVEHLRQSERLDPRSLRAKKWLGDALLLLRRYPEARETLDRGLALAPANLGLIDFKAEVALAQGDLAGARATLKAVPKEVETTALVAWLAYYHDLVWVLDDEQRELLIRLRANAFDDSKGDWGLCLAQAYALKGDVANQRIYAEEARKGFVELLRAGPQHTLRLVNLGLALAYLDEKSDAVRQGEQAVALLPLAKDAWEGAYLQHQLVRIYLLVGEPEKALDRLEPLLKIPYFLSPGWLKIDPNFDPLRRNPRFQKLIASAK
jgi:serine/threonine protein kinase/tetratricopeptide (TPR) repeat protein